LTFFFYRMVEAFPAQLMMVLDAGGLALFAVAGTEKALDYKIHPFMAALLGTITGVGGVRSGTFFWRMCRACCSPIFMPRRRWRVR
jgi:hypothetical protein